VICTRTVGLAQTAPTSVDSIAPMVLNGYSRFPRAIGTAPVYDMNEHRVGSMQKLVAARMGSQARSRSGFRPDAHSRSPPPM
jgi:hypothetical protein